jgi:geranylgeranyl diphosphate synthase, type I
MTSLNDHAQRLLPLVEGDLQAALAVSDHYPTNYNLMLRYHMGWVNSSGQPTSNGDGGKRLRPLLCLLVCESLKGDIAHARPSASAIELIHNFSLLHDDIQDQSPMRRGRPTVWKLWGEAQAINAGDALFTLAHLAIPQLAPTGSSPAIITRLIQILDMTALELTRGQHLDLSFESRDDVTKEDYLDMIAGKTAALVAASAQMGALAGGSSEQTADQLRLFGFNLGMAFQILDDILDIWGDPELTGKQRAVDIYQRKKSLPVLFGFEKNERLRDLYRQDSPFDAQVAGEIVGILGEIGARDYATKLAEEFTTATITHLNNALPTENQYATLLTFANSLLRRDH